MFLKNKKIKSSVKKVDKIIISIIIGSAITSIFHLYQNKKLQEIKNKLTPKIGLKIKKTSKKAVSIFGKIIAFFVYLFSKKK